jgi:hypothetical protein
MSLSNKRAAKNTFYTLGALLILGLAGVGIQRVLTGDPMQAYRADPALNDVPIMEMRDVKLQHYDAGVLVNEAKVAQLDVTRDRMVILGSGVSEGKLYREGKVEFEYEGQRFEWNDATKFLNLNEGMRFFNKDVDLKGSDLTYDQRSGALTIPRGLSGKFYTGNIKAGKLQMNTITGKRTISDVVWTGILPVELTQNVPGGAAKPSKPWVIKGKTQTYENGRDVFTTVFATNGEVIFRADRAERFTDEGTGREIVTASGNVKYYAPELNVLCDKLLIDRKIRRAILEGNVTMFIKPEDEAKLKEEPLKPMRPVVPEEIARQRPTGPTTSPNNEDIRRPESRRRYPVRIYAQKIDYSYATGAKKAIVTGNPQARQELPNGQWRMFWAPEALWDGESEILRMIGPKEKQSVKAVFSNGDSAKADTFWISTARDVDRYGAENVTAEGLPDEEVELPGTGGTPPADTSPPTPMEGRIGA